MVLPARRPHGKGGKKTELHKVISPILPVQVIRCENQVFRILFRFQISALVWLSDVRI